MVKMAKRVMRNIAKRIGDGEDYALTDLMELRGYLDEMLGEAARALNAQGYSWEYIGRLAGRDRSNCYKDWAKPKERT